MMGEIPGHLYASHENSWKFLEKEQIQETRIPSRIMVDLNTGNLGNNNNGTKSIVPGC